jgi:hypothetical protein
VFDFASAQTEDTVVGSFDLPARTDCPLRNDIAYSLVRAGLLADPGGHVGPLDFWVSGAASRMTRSSDGDSVDYEMTWLPLPDGFEPVWIVTLFQSWDWGLGHVSVVDLPGYPAEGHQDITFTDIPVVTNPETAVISHPLHGEPFEWELFESGVTPTLYVLGPAATMQDKFLWRITAPTDATSLTVPEPPGAIDAEAILGTVRVQGRIGLVANDPGDALSKHSMSSVFLIQP